MRQHINKLVFLVIICFIILQFGNGTTEAMKSRSLEASDLITIASVIQGENIQVEEWTIHAREKLTDVKQQKDVENYVSVLKKKFPKWDWNQSETHQYWEATAVSPEHSPFQQMIRIVSTPTKQTTQAYVIYEVSGQAWADSTEQFLETDISSTFSDIFRGKPEIFSCVKAELDGKMKTTLTSKKNGLLEAFNANEIESLSENKFISVTASSPLFAESLKRNHDSMNLQLGLRTTGMGSQTTLVVGTPIITIEY